MSKSSGEGTSNRLAEAIGECYRGEDLADWLNVTEDELEQARESHQYLAMKTADNHWVYPVFQFLPGTSETLPSLQKILLILASGIEDEWSHGLWLTSRIETQLDGKSVHEWLLHNGDIEEVIRLAQIDAASWAR